MGVAFLKEAKRRLAGRAGALFDEAVAHYTVVQHALKMQTDLFPFGQGAADQTVGSPEGAAAMRAAAAEEAKGLDALSRIADALEG